MSDSQEKNWYECGRQDGREEAQSMFVEVRACKGEDLTRSEIRLLAGSLFNACWAEWSDGSSPPDWFGAWCPAFALACLQAEQAAPQQAENEPPAIVIRDWLRKRVPPDLIREASPALSFQMYHAHVEDSDLIPFFEGVQAGQDAQREDQARPTVSNLFGALARGPVLASEEERRSESYLLGSIIGRMDVLLHDRRHSPLYTAGYEECVYV